MPGKHKNRVSYADPSRPRGTRLTVQQRTQILTLYNLAKWNQSQIARELRIAHSTVRLVIRSGSCLPKPPPTGPKKKDSGQEHEADHEHRHGQEQEHEHTHEHQTEPVSNSESQT